jgi:hypothetical protein
MNNMTFEVKAWIPVEPDEPIFYKTLQEALDDKASLELMQPENRYEIIDTDTEEVIDPDPQREQSPDDSDLRFYQECGLNVRVVEPEPEPVEWVVKTVLGYIHLNCHTMPCYTPNRQRGYCMMDGCGKIFDTVARFGPIIGMQIVNKAMARYQPEYDMEVLLEGAATDIVGTV